MGQDTALILSRLIWDIGLVSIVTRLGIANVTERVILDLLKVLQHIIFEYPVCTKIDHYQNGIIIKYLITGINKHNIITK